MPAMAPRVGTPTDNSIGIDALATLERGFGGRPFERFLGALGDPALKALLPWSQQS